MDRSTLAIANSLIRHDLGLSIADMGLLLSAFLWAYAAFQLPAGALVYVCMVPGKPIDVAAFGGIAPAPA